MITQLRPVASSRPPLQAAAPPNVEPLFAEATVQSLRPVGSDSLQLRFGQEKKAEAKEKNWFQKMWDGITGKLGAMWETVKGWFGGKKDGGNAQPAAEAPQKHEHHDHEKHGHDHKAEGGKHVHTEACAKGGCPG